MAFTKKYINGSYYWRFDITYKDKTGMRRRKASKWYKTKTEAKKALEQFKKEGQNTLATKGKITFKQAADAYIESVKDTQAVGTIRHKKASINTYFFPLHNKRIEKITTKDLKSTLENNEQFQALSSGGKNTVLNVLRVIFEFASDTYGLEYDPAKSLRRYPKTTEEKVKKRNIWTPSQFDEFLKVIPDDKQIWADFFSFLFWTGCRLNEGLSLRWIDWDSDTHIIYFQYQYINDEFKPLKTASARRRIIVDDKTAAMLEKLHREQRQEKNYTDDWFIFGGSKKKTHRGAQWAFSVFRRQVLDRLPYVTIHDLRHSHVSYLISQKVDPYLIQKRVGHSSYQITMDIYGHLMGNRDDEILKVINR